MDSYIFLMNNSSIKNVITFSVITLLVSVEQMPTSANSRGRSSVVDGDPTSKKIILQSQIPAERNRMDATTTTMMYVLQ